LNPGASAAQINSAISSCGAGQKVHLNAGNYNLSGGIAWSGKSSVTLEGAGADQTHLIFSANGGCHGEVSYVCLDPVETNWGGGPSNSANWTAGFTKGTTSITLSSTSNLKVGNPLILDETDDSSDTGSRYICQSTSSSCSLEGNQNNGNRNNRDHQQTVLVVSCGSATSTGQACNGTNVTISPGLYMDFSSGKSPGAWWATSPVHDNGIENLSVENTDGSDSRGITIINCFNCWIKGVRTVKTKKAHWEAAFTTHVTIRDSYAFLTRDTVSQSYGFHCFGSTDTLVENNILQQVATPLQLNSGCEGTVVAYNVSRYNFFTTSSGYSPPATMQHAGGVDMVLYEGNDINGSYGDNFHGTHNFVTFFRNRMSGTDTACWSGGTVDAANHAPCISNQVVFDVRAYSRFYNIIGNVLGTSGLSNGYQSGSKPIYQFGSGNTEGSVTVGTDSMVASTILRWGNYDTVNGSVLWQASEVPSGIGEYANAVPGSQSLPPSFFYATKPGWWPSGKAWPLTGPDVTGGNIANVGGHANTNPALDCYLNTMRGPADGTGSVLNFNAGSCYGSGSGVSNPPPNPPAPPTGLTAITT
jgi:hypothetical protein